MKNKKTKKYHSLRNASILFGIIFTTIGLMATAFFGPRDEGLTAVSLLLTMLSLLIGAMLYLIYVGKIKGAKLSFIALGLSKMADATLVMAPIATIYKGFSGLYSFAIFAMNVAASEGTGVVSFGR